MTDENHKLPIEQGLLIAVEGMDGSGKSTQAMLLFNWIRALGLPVHHTEWNSSPVVAAATKAGKDSKRLKPQTFHLIHAADFADRWSKQIEPMLEVGGIVICDRYKFTAMARDGARGVDRETIESNYSFAREPDVTLYFDIPPEIGYDRIVKGRPTLKYYEAGLDMGWTFDPFESYKILQSKIKEIYDGLVEDERIVRVDARGTVTEVQSRVRALIKQYVNLDRIQPIDENDRMAEMIRMSSFDWSSLEEGQ
ncbi:MAG: dTMP kinase [Candidatus Thermoplasmatota archaeon]|nr:dTMP kinase [Candidatus Thermoplasmatota archaeon]